MRLLAFGPTPHQCGHGLLRRALTLQHRYHRLGNRHLHAQLRGARHHGLGAVHTLGHMAQRIQYMLKRLALCQRHAHLPIATEVARGSQHQVAKATQAHEGIGARPQGQP